MMEKDVLSTQWSGECLSSIEGEYGELGKSIPGQEDAKALTLDQANICGCQREAGMARAQEGL